MGAIFAIGHGLIGFLNGIFGVCTLVMITGGIIIKFQSPILKKFGQSTLDDIQVSVDAMFPDQDWNTDNWNLNDILGSVALFFIAAGGVLFILCIIGCSASCCKVKCLLIVYAVIVAVLLLMQVILLIVVYATPSTLRDPVKTSLRDSLQNFQGLNGTNTNSVTWNFMMRYYACCGVANYQDFKDYSSWWGKSEHVTPYTCCVELPTTSAEADSCSGASANLPIDFLIDSNYANGCVEAVGNFFFVDHKLTVIMALVFVFLAQVLLVVFSVVLTNENDGKVGPWANDEYSRSRPPKKVEAPSLTSLSRIPIDMNYNTNFKAHYKTKF